MKDRRIVGIIAEYNPFHYGHIYHIKKTKELFPDCILILVVSGSFVQRGDFSVLTKWEKTDLALDFGVDLVVELPFVFATQSADQFAKGSVSILNNLGVDTIVFGSECNDVSLLKKMAEIQLVDPDYQKLVQQFLNSGMNYKMSLAKALTEVLGVTIIKPNDLLGVSYLKEIISLGDTIEAVTIQRTNDFHEKSLEKIASATSIRTALKDKQDIKNYVPIETYQYLTRKPFSLEDSFPYLKYQIITLQEDLTLIQGVDEGIEHRILKVITTCDNFSDFLEQIKTKRYTYQKLRRMCLHILTHFTKTDASLYSNIQSIRLLGFRDTGRTYLRDHKKEFKIPLSSTYDTSLAFELKMTSIYALLANRQELIKEEYQRKPIQKP